MPDIALYQPDIPQNTGTILRLAACMGTTVHMIKPFGFVMSDQSMKRSGMDYLERASIETHDDWLSFNQWRISLQRRIVLFTTKSDCDYTQFEFKSDDILLMGRESSGVPDNIHKIADACLRIPMKDGMRSLNVAVAAGMAIGEAYRQTDSFDPPDPK